MPVPAPPVTNTRWFLSSPRAFARWTSVSASSRLPAHCNTCPPSPSSAMSGRSAASNRWTRSGGTGPCSRNSLFTATVGYASAGLANTFSAGASGPRPSGGTVPTSGSAMAWHMNMPSNSTPAARRRRSRLCLAFITCSTGDLIALSYCFHRPLSIVTTPPFTSMRITPRVGDTRTMSISQSWPPTRIGTLGTQDPRVVEPEQQGLAHPPLGFGQEGEVEVVREEGRHRSQSGRVGDVTRRPVCAFTSRRCGYFHLHRHALKEPPVKPTVKFDRTLVTVLVDEVVHVMLELTAPPAVPMDRAPSTSSSCSIGRARCRVHLSPPSRRPQRNSSASPGRTTDSASSPSTTKSSWCSPSPITTPTRRVDPCWRSTPAGPPTSRPVG